jgi:hypothetical protein
MPYKDAEFQKLYDKLKYQRNREKRIEQARANALRRKDEIAAYQREYSKKNRERKNYHRRQWRTRPEHKERERIAQREWRKKNPDKAKKSYERYVAKNKPQYIAHVMMRAAINCGYIVKPKICENCGADGRIHGHHVDYSKIFEVEWLCHACHVKAHNGSFSNPPITLRSARPQAEQ